MAAILVKTTIRKNACVNTPTYYMSKKRVVNAYNSALLATAI